MNRDLEISEDHHIKFSYNALYAIVTALIAGVICITTLNLHVTSNTEDIVEIQSNTEELKEVITRIDKNVVEINTTLKLNQKQNKEK